MSTATLPPKALGATKLRTFTERVEELAKELLAAIPPETRDDVLGGALCELADDAADISAYLNSASPEESASAFIVNESRLLTALKGWSQ